MASGMKLCVAAKTSYCSGVGKLLYLVKWSCPEIANSVMDLTWFMTEAFCNCVKGMEHMMQNVLSMPECGLAMQPDGRWDGNKEYEFEVDGISDLAM